MILAAALSPSLDITYSLADLRLGQIHRPTEIHRMAGGKALNAARAAAVLGADVAAVAVLGGATGSLISDACADAGVPLTRVHSTVPTRSCISIHSAASGELTEIYEPAVEVSASELGGVVEAVTRIAAEGTGWLLIAGGMPTSVPPDTVPELIRHARALGWRVAVDTHGAALGHAADAHPDVVKVNRAEARELLGAVDDLPLTQLADALHRRTMGIAVITDGVDGAVVSDGAMISRVRLRHPVGQFAVGSGDSFFGGLVAGLDRGSTLAESMRIAAACGTANALVPGAARFDRDTVYSLAPEVEFTTARSPSIGVAPALRDPSD